MNLRVVGSCAKFGFSDDFSSGHRVRGIRELTWSVEMRMQGFRCLWALGSFYTFERRRSACHTRSLPKTTLAKVPLCGSFQSIGDTATFAALRRA